MGKTVRMREDTYEALIKRGTAGDSIDDVIRTLLKLPKRSEK